MTHLRQAAVTAMEIKNTFAETKDSKTNAELIEIVELLIALNLNSLRIRAVLQEEDINDVLTATTTLS